MSTTGLLHADPVARRNWGHRACAAAGAGFVVLTFAGNSLTESAVDPTSEVTGGQALGNFAAQASSTAARLGLTMELAGFLAFAVFAGCVVDTVRRLDALRVAGVLAAVSATVMLAVKLGSGAPYLVGLGYHASLTPDTALALSLSNGAAFVLCWLPFALFVMSAAWALHKARVLGRFGMGAGVVIGALGVPAALAGALDLDSAMPVPFLLGCLWTVVVSAKLAISR